MAEVYFNGPEGKIEGRYHQSLNKTAPVALILHPHPLHGGTMNNKVAYYMYKVFASNGFTVLRINFRGVGKSEGIFDNGVGEILDASAALDWLQMQNPEAPHYWIGGFSFGAWVGLNLIMRRPEVESFIAAGPPATKYDFTFLSPCPAHGIIIQGEKDEVTSEADSAKLYEFLVSQNKAEIYYDIIPAADHFFTNHMVEFVNKCNDYINLRLATRIEKPIRKKRRKRRKKKV